MTAEFSDDAAFRSAVSTVLRSLLDQIDGLDSEDHDPMLSEGNLKILFESGGTFVLSQQTPLHELWLSANLTAWHFVHGEDGWVERDSGEDMLALFGRLVSEKVGETVTFSS